MRKSLKGFALKPFGFLKKYPVFYDVSGAEPRVVFVPGGKFTTGLVLHYDDMPELMAPITIDENGMFTIHEISRREI